MKLLLPVVVLCFVASSDAIDAADKHRKKRLMDSRRGLIFVTEEATKNSKKGKGCKCGCDCGCCDIPFQTELEDCRFFAQCEGDTCSGEFLEFCDGESCEFDCSTECESECKGASQCRGFNSEAMVECPSCECDCECECCPQSNPKCRYASECEGEDCIESQCNRVPCSSECQSLCASDSECDASESTCMEALSFESLECDGPEPGA